MAGDGEGLGAGHCQTHLRWHTLLDGPRGHGTGQGLGRTVSSSTQWSFLGSQLRLVLKIKCGIATTVRITFLLVLRLELGILHYMIFFHYCSLRYYMLFALIGIVCMYCIYNEFDLI